MRNINLELYKIFYEVGKQKNITKASNTLFISQPAITQQIKKLENELNYKLFYRTKYGVEFTTEGEKLFNDISESMILLENVPDTLDKFHNVINSLRFVSSFGSARMLITPKIPKILKEYPDINIYVEKYDNDGIIQSLLNNSADVAIINDNSLQTENIIYYESIVVERIFVASKKFYQKNNVEKITKNNLSDYPFIATGKKSATRIILDNYLAQNCISLTPKLDIDSFEMTLDLILKDMGIAVFNKPYIKEYLDSGKLIELKSDIKFPAKTLYVAVNKKNVNNEFIKNIVKLILS